MKASTSTHNGKKYLHITRSSYTDLDDVKASRKNIIPLFQDLGIERFLSDCRNINFDDVSSIELDILAKDLKSDFPSCNKVAVLCEPDSLNLFQHYENLGANNNLDVQLYSELESAKSWLCES
ncbi:MAG: hypothetical protein V7739_04600 [Motiliproteus sp.]